MQKKREIQSSTRYFLSFLIGTLIFLLGFVIVYSVYYLEYQKILQKQTEMSYDIFEDKLKYSLFDEDICSEGAYEDISEDLAFQGDLIFKLEEQLGKYDKNVIERKKFYSLILVEHFDFVKYLEQNCNFSMNTILFFYSNDKELIAQSDELGRILSVVYTRNPEDVVIYSFDVNLDSDLTRILKEKYNVTEAPMVIINEKDRLYGINNINNIEGYLN